MPRKFRRVLRKGYSQKKLAKHQEASLACSDDESNMFDTTEVSVQTETVLTAMISVEVQTDLTVHPDCYKLDAAIQCSVEEENKENLPPQDSSVGYMMCEGNKDEKFYPLVEKHKGIFKDASGHVMAYYDYQQCTIRHVQCPMRIPESSTKRCSHCKSYRVNVLHSGLSRLLKLGDTQQKARCTADSHVNYRYLSTPEKVERMHKLHSAVRVSKRKISDLQERLDRAIQKDGVRLDECTSNGLVSILNKHDQNPSSETFSSIFWQQQLRAASTKDKRGMRWHPAVIRWCLYLHHKSSGCYATLRNSGVINLPSDRTLRDYRHSSSAKAGFSKETDLELFEAIAQQKPRHLAKYVGLTLDEMHVKEGLFFDKHTGALVGYSDLGEINNILSDYEKQLSASRSTQRPMAKLMLVFMVRGLFTSLKFPYVQFPAASTKGGDIFPLVRQAIKHLTRLGLHVMTITCDGASDNRRMFVMFNDKSALSYKTNNVYSKDSSQIFFISDPPHLIKTIRNCFSRGKLWCAGRNINWNLIVELYKRNAGATSETPGLCLVPKLKYEHVYLTNFSKMRVDLAAQVLSETVSKALYFFGDEREDSFETAYFIDKIDKFFDTLNVSSFNKGKHKRKPFCEPFRSPNDFRMKFMKSVLAYLDHWKLTVQKRAGPFSAADRKQMMLSDITQNGMRITVHSFLELIPIVFKIPGVVCFMTEKLSQDPLEKFFGCQRQQGNTNDNPKVHEFLTNTQSLRVIDSINVHQITGNCRGTKRKHYDLESVDLSRPLKRRKRHRSS